MNGNETGKYSKPKGKNSAGKTFVIAALAVLVAAEGACIGFLLNRNDPHEKATGETVAIAEKADTSDKKIVELYAVATDTVDLKYGLSLADRIYAQISDDDVTFFADVPECEAVKLFTIELNSDSENIIGIIADKKDQEVAVGLAQYPYEGSIKAETAEKLDFIRETLIDDVLSNLVFLEGPYEKTIQDPFFTENMAIDTDYVQLFYPQKWESYLSTTDSGNAVEFFCCLENRKPIKLFTVQFHNDAIDCVGTVNDIPVALTLEDIPADDSWSEDEQETVYTMLEDSYVIIDGLIRYNGLTLNQ